MFSLKKIVALALTSSLVWTTRSTGFPDHNRLNTLFAEQTLSGRLMVSPKHPFSYSPYRRFFHALQNMSYTALRVQDPYTPRRYAGAGYAGSSSNTQAVVMLRSTKATASILGFIENPLDRQRWIDFLSSINKHTSEKQMQTALKALVQKAKGPVYVVIESRGRAYIVKHRSSTQLFIEEADGIVKEINSNQWLRIQTLSMQHRFIFIQPGEVATTETVTSVVTTEPTEQAMANELSRLYPRVPETIVSRSLTTALSDEDVIEDVAWRLRNGYAVTIYCACSANTNRSAAAHLLLRDMANEAGLSLTVYSGGLNVDKERRNGKPLPESVKKALLEFGIPPNLVNGFISRPVDKNELQKADIILTADMDIERALHSRFPGIGDRTVPMSFLNSDIRERYFRNLPDPQRNGITFEEMLEITSTLVYRFLKPGRTSPTPGRLTRNRLLDFNA